MKVPPLFTRKKKKLRASTARRSLVQPEMEYEEMAEPNMKLSRALLIVLVLHVVAVAGIIAFNTIKSRQGAFPPPAKVVETAKSAPAPTAAPETENSEPTQVSNSATSVRRDDVAAPANVLKALPVESDSGKVYVVVKGDNPVKIAKKLKVSESELLSVNHIDDPRKLQIGQKLIVPAKASKERKTR